MIAEILSTGDEIRTGALVDTNAAWMADRLEMAGITVSRHLSVGDDVDELVSAFKEIAERADIALVTGGLGPTTDDLTSEAAGKALDLPLEIDEQALKEIQEFFSSRNRKMPESNRKQALFPKGSSVLYNPIGTAPGFSFVMGKCRFFCMPGVPFEMRRMFRDHAMPMIADAMGADRSIHEVRTLSLFGLPESTTGERVADLESRFSELKLGLRAKFPMIQVKIYGNGADEARLKRQLDEAEKWAADRLGDAVFSNEGEPMEAVLGRLLKEKNATVAVAESCTGGLISSLLTDVSGSSDYFLFGGVTYSNEAKEKVLGVSSETLVSHGAVSEETAAEMADGVRKTAGADYGIATSGVAGPTGGTEEKPVGTVCIGVATPEKVMSYRFVLRFATRLMNKQMFAMKAMDLLRRELEGI